MVDQQTLSAFTSFEQYFNDLSRYGIYQIIKLVYVVLSYVECFSLISGTNYVVLIFGF